CRTAKFRTIQSAVNAAPAGGTVVVCAGTYREQVVLAKPLSLRGQHAVIDETGVIPGFKITLPGLGTATIFAGVVIVSSRVTITGFKVKNAQGEGILAAGLGGTITGINVSGNAVVHNDLGGGVPPKSPYFQCAAQGQVPGDCGEGVHFAGGVAYSTIRGNYIANNSGGILLSDDVGPTHNNLIADNIVTGNTADCGITVPGHNPMALNAKGKPQPQVAGVYKNVIKNNVVTNNGVKGQGAGVLFANAGPGTASYDNLVQGNYIAGNGLSGVTMHAHTIAKGQFEDLNGNVIVSNAIGKNNLDGDTLDGPPVTDPHTTGVLVFSGGTRVWVVIAHNHIFNNYIGIWLSKVVKAVGLRTNVFIHVTTRVSGGH
ncbi:MAG TPA: right-handed parallel beta-helix repeat-containing protein, partial [Streptosporangiaceae bacterium]